MSRCLSMLSAFVSIAWLGACEVGTHSPPPGEPSADAAPPATDAPPTTPTDPPPLTAAQALAKLGACMQRADWDAATLGDISQLGNGACLSCHTGGSGGVYILSDPTRMFEAHRITPGIGTIATATSDGAGGYTFSASTKLVDWSLNPGGGHISFTVPDAIQQGIPQFFQATLQRYQAQGGECIP